MKARKWNIKTREYEEIEISDDCKIWCQDMDTKTACAQCEKKIKYGDAYTSRFIHNHAGFGYPVCVDCYEKELRKEGIIK